LFGVNREIEDAKFKGNHTPSETLISRIFS
jgi:hypothetical protein